MLSKTFKLLLALVFFNIYSNGLTQEYSEGFEYKKLKSPFQTNTIKDKVEVREIFWYGCPHCYNLEPVLKGWKHPAHINIVIMPAISPKGWAGIGAQTYYTAQALGITNKIHTPFFEAIHRNNNKKLNTDVAEIASFFERYGIKEDKFYDAWNSFSVDSKLKKAKRIFVRSEVTGVPAFVVNGKYLTSPSMAGGSHKMLKVIEYLAKKELGR